ncbi:DUF4174 domain-containing protein [Microvirga sp. SRT01]|uniref:DUF4174 domain-containing protein n=1 Tax=Sphingomonas longa TaxID=2778730 RepID=A0ABS2DD96_9SPHN|nr:MULTISPECIES: DUF4174 domain-containing protein [Alphaproteobacteria]MBM6578071.1 DUF4174 domain-containing protein [Sphingomonas sp. BT552]MBR7711112.1 DUF4174 domain-containing protein [Microvirga sp. SRT01]
MTALLALAAAAAAAAGPAIADLRWERRVLVVAAPRADDPAFLAQRRALGGWDGAADRDVTVVEVAGDRVTGVRDDAAAIRNTYALPAARFAVILIGKDGHVAVRSGEPILAESIQSRIDAMPMRRAGRR